MDLVGILSTDKEIKDDSEHFKHISDMLEFEKYQVIITAGIILETCWILSKVFEFSNPQVGHAFLHLLQVENVEPEEESSILTLNIYARHENIDITDCFLSAEHQKLTIFQSSHSTEIQESLVLSTAKSVAMIFTWIIYKSNAEEFHSIIRMAPFLFMVNWEPLSTCLTRLLWENHWKYIIHSTHGRQIDGWEWNQEYLTFWVKGDQPWVR